MRLSQLSFTESLQFVSNASVFVRNHYEWGDFYKLSLPFYNIYVVTSPDILHHVLIHNEKNYQKSRIYWKQLKLMVGDALGTLEGDEWVWMKKLQTRHFTHKAVGAYFSTIIQNRNRFYDKWEKNGKLPDLIQAFSIMNVSAILKILFGVDQHQKLGQIAESIADGEEIIAYRSKFPWRPGLASLNGRNKRYKKYVSFFDTVADQAINRNLTEGEVHNLLSDLIDKSPIKGEDKVSVDMIRNEMIIHLGASTETAAVVEGWTLFLLSRHPDYLEKVREEVDRIAEAEITVDHLPELIFTTWCIKESMRLYPPSHAIIRDALGDDEINGHPIKKGDTLFISAYGLHRNPNFWEAPDDFLPERFEHEDQFVQYSYIPFGAGRHSCIGRYLGLPLIILSIAEFIRRFDFSLNTSTHITPLSLSTLKPDDTFGLVLSKRN